jgi:hypothetical protein
MYGIKYELDKFVKDLESFFELKTKEIISQEDYDLMVNVFKDRFRQSELINQDGLGSK